MSKKTVKKIADDLGNDAIAAALSVTTHSVRNARWAGSFPANWYGVISDMCVERGIDCPRDAFAFKTQQESTAK